MSCVGTRLQIEFRDSENNDGVESEVGPLNISAAKIEQITFVFNKPDGTAAASKTYTDGEVKLAEPVEGSGLAAGEDGIAYYDAEEGFIDQPRTWKLQGFVELAGGAKHSAKVITFEVEDVLAR